MRVALIALFVVQTLAAARVQAPVTYRITAKVTSYKYTQGRVGADRKLIPGSFELTLVEEPPLPKTEKPQPRYNPRIGHPRPATALSAA